MLPENSGSGPVGVDFQSRPKSKNPATTHAIMAMRGKAIKYSQSLFMRDRSCNAMALHFATNNFVRPHGTLTKEADGRKTTPAMRAGLTDHHWTMDELLGKIAGYEVEGPVIPD
jgi:hypothetical protein